MGYDGTDYSVRQIMNRVAEYKYHAQECREQAKRMQQPEDRDALERLASSGSLARFTANPASFIFAE